jgi:hypothetical protein
MAAWVMYSTTKTAITKKARQNPLVEDGIFLKEPGLESSKDPENL